MMAVAFAVFPVQAQYTVLNTFHCQSDPTYPQNTSRVTDPIETSIWSTLPWLVALGVSYS